MEDFCVVLSINTASVNRDATEETFLRSGGRMILPFAAQNFDTSVIAGAA